MIQNKKFIFILIVIIIAIISISFIVPMFFRKNPNPINVIIIVIDALRPDHLGCYGYERDTSPNIDKLAKEGVRFTQAIAAGGWTVESVPSILTGTYSLTHNIRYLNGLRDQQIGTFVQELAMRDYQCVLWANLSTLRLLDVKDGFQRQYITSIYKNMEGEGRESPLSEYLFTNLIINRLRKYYRKLPFFFYIHYKGCHAPYRPPAPYKYMYLHDKYKKKLGSLPISNDNEGDAVYDGYKKIPYVVVENNINDPNYYIIQYDSVISYIDAQIGRLLDSLKALDLDKNTLIILTSDHGEMLGEHNIYFSHMLTYEENIKVPLIIRFPKLFPKGKVISRQVSLVDIAPTILEIVGLKKPSYMQGESLLAFTKPLRVYNKKYVLSCFKHLIALRAGDWKIIHNSRNDSYELYNLKDDPKEQHNLLVERTDKFKQLKQELCRWQERITASTPLKEGPPLTEKDKAHLKSLGYAQ